MKLYIKFIHFSICTHTFPAILFFVVMVALLIIHQSDLQPKYTIKQIPVSNLAIRNNTKASRSFR
ncbi:hypothetical protein FJR11_20110 [Anabaena sp. UHCC 0187]|nr:hypothetical protein [Anabaena sp. UHCC 0187]